MGVFSVYLISKGAIVFILLIYFSITSKSTSLFNILNPSPNISIVVQIYSKYMEGPVTNIGQIHKMESFRRALVFGTGFSLLLISIVSAKNMDEYYVTEFSDIYDILLLIFSAWGIYYVVFLWFSFLLMGI